MRAISILAAAIGLTAFVGMLGCTSVVKRENGTWDVPRQIETRSVFGTNQSAMEIQTCKTEVVKWYWENTYKDCMELVPYAQASSPGVGGPIVSGMVMGLGFGLGLAHSGTGLNQHVDNGGVIYNKPVK